MEAKRAPWDQYEILRKEAMVFDSKFEEKFSLVVGNKGDLPGVFENSLEFERCTRIKPILISAKTGMNVEELVRKLREEFIDKEDNANNEDEEGNVFSESKR